MILPGAYCDPLAWAAITAKPSRKTGRDRLPKGQCHGCRSMPILCMVSGKTKLISGFTTRRRSLHAWCRRGKSLNAVLQRCSEQLDLTQHRRGVRAVRLLFPVIEIG